MSTWIAFMLILAVVTLGVGIVSDFMDTAKIGMNIRRVLCATIKIEN